MCSNCCSVFTEENRREILHFFNYCRTIFNDGEDVAVPISVILRQVLKEIKDTGEDLIDVKRWHERIYQLAIEYGGDLRGSTKDKLRFYSKF